MTKNRQNPRFSVVMLVYLIAFSFLVSIPWAMPVKAQTDTGPFSTTSTVNTSLNSTTTLTTTSVSTVYSTFTKPIAQKQ